MTRTFPPIVVIRPFDSKRWLYQYNPVEVGWYATLTCWEPLEGRFPGATYWDGTGWKTRRKSAIVAFSSEPLESEELARQWAEDNDPDDVEDGDRGVES